MLNHLFSPVIFILAFTSCAVSVQGRNFMEPLERLFACAPGAQITDTLISLSDVSWLLTHKHACAYMRSRGKCSYENALEMRRHTHFDPAKLANITTLLHSSDTGDSVKAQLEEVAGMLVNATALQLYHSHHTACMEEERGSTDLEETLACIGRPGVGQAIEEGMVPLCGNANAGPFFTREDAERLKTLADKVFKSNDYLSTSDIASLLELLNNKFECFKTAAEQHCPNSNRTLTGLLTIVNFYFNLTQYADFTLSLDRTKPLPDTLPAYFDNYGGRNHNKTAGAGTETEATSPRPSPEKSSPFQEFTLESLMDLLKKARMFKKQYQLQEQYERGVTLEPWALKVL